MNSTGKDPVALACYEGFDIEFLRSGRYVNLTQMAEATGKRVRNWTRLKTTQELLACFEKSPVYGGAPPLKVKRGRDFANSSDLGGLSLSTILNGDVPPGVWVHPHIAIQFAQWASPQFALWVSAQIEALLTYGEVHLHHTQWTSKERLQGQERNRVDEAEIVDCDRFHGRQL